MICGTSNNIFPACFPGCVVRDSAYVRLSWLDSPNRKGSGSACNWHSCRVRFVVFAIKNLVCESSGDGSPEIDFQRSETVGRLEPVLENAIYRIVQEGISNAQQHSKTDRIRVSLEKEDYRVRVEVQDWGIGFDVNKIQGHSIGLKGIKERAKLLGGEVAIETGPGSGTRVVVDLPIQLPEDSSMDTDS